MSLDNQILHFNVSVRGPIPPNSIRVGNFVIGYPGDRPNISYRQFRRGINPQSFTCSEAGVEGLKKQTYSVYIHKNNSGDILGPNCYLFSQNRIIPNVGDPYFGGVTSQEPWYHLTKYVQLLTSGITPGVSDQIGIFKSTLSQDITTGIFQKALVWFVDQSSLSDNNNYQGGISGNRIVVNKFYPPILTDNLLWVYDASFVASNPYVLGSSGIGRLYNLSGVTPTGTSQFTFDWDMEGGTIQSNDIPLSNEDDFNLLNKSQFSLYVYFSVTSTTTNEGLKIFTCMDPTSKVGIEIISKTTSGVTNLLVFISNNIPQSYGMSQFSVQIQSSRWYVLCLTKDNLEWNFYLNGVKVSPSLSLSINSSNNFSTSISKVSSGGMRFGFSQFYTVSHNQTSVINNYLRSCLSSKTKTENLVLSLNSTTKLSHIQSTDWRDVSPYRHDGTSQFSIHTNPLWSGYKPRWVSSRFFVPGSSVLDILFLGNFTISIWFYIVDKNIPCNIFKKGDVVIDQQPSELVFFFDCPGPGDTRTTSITDYSSQKWYNVIVTGISGRFEMVYLFSHNLTEETLSESFPTWGDRIDTQTNLAILIGDDNQNVRISSVELYNSYFSRDLSRTLFHSKRGFFGFDYK